MAKNLIRAKSNRLKQRASDTQANELSDSENLNKPPLVKHKTRRSIGYFPEILVGLMLISGGLIFSLFIYSPDKIEGVDVLVLSDSIQKGEVLKIEQLMTVKVQMEQSINLLSPNSAPIITGQRALLDLPARAPVLSEHFSNSPEIEADYVLAGLRLKLGQYPTTHLTTGDFVDIVSSSFSEGSLNQVEVYSVVPLGKDEGADFFITLLIPEPSKQIFARLIGEGDVRLFINPVP